MEKLLMALIRRTILSAVFGAAVLAPIWAAPAAIARMPYDGNWSVLIVTDSGDCDRAYRYEVRIEDGKVGHGEQNFDISGRVGEQGQIAVTVKLGQQEASGTGRLARDNGQGSWTGNSPTTRCSGHWEAERRS
jgi:hypothetical protein